MRTSGTLDIDGSSLLSEGRKFVKVQSDASRREKVCQQRIQRCRLLRLSTITHQLMRMDEKR